MNDSPAIHQLTLFALLVFLFAVLSPSARAWNDALDAPPSALATITSPDGESRVLLRPDPAWSAAYDTNLWIRTRLLITTLLADTAVTPPVLTLAPLTSSFDPAAVTWETAPSPRTPTITAANAFYTNLPVPLARYAFDLAPILASTKARNDLFANGAVLSADTASADTFTLAPDSLLFRAVIPPATAIAFAVGYIDSAPRYGSGTSATVLWEQGFSTVGKVALNGTDGSECRALLTLPDDIAALPPATIATLVADFDLEVNETNGTERLLLFPLADGPALERRRWEDYDSRKWSDDTPPRPTHGPSWAYADGPADGQTGPATPWARPMVSYTDGVLGDGPWLDIPGLTPVVATLSELSAAKKRATFDLIGLWRDPTARDALIANGAIVLLDPAGWPDAFARQKSPRLNLYRPDPYAKIKHPDKYSFATIVPFPRFTDIAPAPDSLTLAVTNLDPYADFDLDSSPALLPSDWSPLAPADAPTVVAPATTPSSFFRLRQRP